jgi:hypothetical protein
MANDIRNGNDMKESESGAESDELRDDDIEIHVAESDIKNLTILDRSDIVFAVLYGVLFVWGLVLTLLSI